MFSFYLSMSGCGHIMHLALQALEGISSQRIEISEVGVDGMREANGGGTFVPGGSSGNFLGMLAARQHCMPETMST